MDPKDLKGKMFVIDFVPYRVKNVTINDKQVILDITNIEDEIDSRLSSLKDGLDDQKMR